VGCREDDIENETNSDIRDGNTGYAVDQKNGGKLSRRGRTVAQMPCFTKIVKDKDKDLLSSWVRNYLWYHNGQFTNMPHNVSTDALGNDGTSTVCVAGLHSAYSFAQDFPIVPVEKGKT
jgi:hypothetical protein